MLLFKKQTHALLYPYDPTSERAVIHSNTCNRDRVAGFKDIHTGQFHEVMLIRDEKDLNDFKRLYNIQEDIKRE